MLRHDLDDVRCHPEAVIDGCHLIDKLRYLDKQVHAVQREHLMLKFWGSLQTHPYVKIPRMEKPYGEEEETEYLSALDEMGVSCVSMHALQKTARTNAEEAAVKMKAEEERVEQLQVELDRLNEAPCALPATSLLSLWHLIGPLMAGVAARARD